MSSLTRRIQRRAIRKRTQADRRHLAMLAHLGVTEAEFDAEVEKMKAEMEAEHQAKEAADDGEG